MIDIIIFGSGIAGLWTLTRLRKLGYQAILLESGSIGSGQSGASQGIIHGGTKYALTGKLTHSSQSIGAMPGLWRRCFSPQAQQNNPEKNYEQKTEQKTEQNNAGQDLVDLRRVQILSQHQYLWANKNIGSQLTGFFAGKVMKSRMQTIEASAYPHFFAQDGFNGTVYQLDEPVLDSLSLLTELYRQNQEVIYHFNTDSIEQKQPNQYMITGEGLTLNAKALIFTAGNGNRSLLKMAGFDQPQMQQRPLYQPLIKSASDNLPLIHAHCLGTSALPRLTITAYKMGDETVWYLGGEIAEKGVELSLEEQVAATKKELKTWVPWLSFNQCQFSAYKINRAEPKMPGTKRPAEPYVSQQEGVITAWPVKLAMTPLMSDQIIEAVKQLNISPFESAIEPLKLNSPPIAKTPWERIEQWI